MQRRNGNRPSIRALLFLGIGLLIAGHAHAAALVCAVDLNGNGQIDQGETATCIGDAGTLCPLDAVACSPAESAPTCPTGGAYVSADDQCEAVSWMCSLDGSQYDDQTSCTSACSQTAACTAAGCPYGPSYACDAE